MTTPSERLRARHRQPTTFKPTYCLECGQAWPCDTIKALDALETASLWLLRLAEKYDPGDTEGGKAAIEALRQADMRAYRGTQ